MKRLSILIIAGLLTLTGCFESSSTTRFAPETLVITDGNITIGTDETKALTLSANPSKTIVSEIKWTSSNEAVLTVDGKGNVFGKSPGMATVTASTLNNLKSAVKIMVNAKTTIVGSNELYQTISPSSSSFNFRLENLSGKNVYFVFTNTNLANAEISPGVYGKNMAQNSAPVAAQSVVFVREKPAADTPVSGKSYITEYNRNPEKYLDGGISPAKYSAMRSMAPSSYSVGNTKEFWVLNSSDGNTSAPSTLRKIVTAGDVNLYVWVENASWVGGSKANLVNQDMVDIMADKFLKSGTNNDIYDWETNIISVPWGAHPYSNLIEPTKDIHILLADIEQDNSTTGGTVGYFWSKDNYKLTSESHSNEKVMFTIDSVMYATIKTTESGWKLTNYWPQICISSLAHEFQHMIQYYQKQVLRGGSPEPWINEMASMSMEDLVADKILTNGPRGVAYNDYTAGLSGNSDTGGRLPLYNYYNDDSVINYFNGEDALRNYSIGYALGAYLMRNYGGANFVKALVQNSHGDYKAVEYAMEQNGGNNTNFQTVLQRFGIANLLSDRTDNSGGYIFNRGGVYTTNINGIDYNLGSINLFNYSIYGVNGPYLYTYDKTMPTTFTKASNTYFSAGTNLSGSKEWLVSNLDPDVKMTVIIK